ncbi:MAG: FAD:protein FMN transferase [Candidatus Omnitrophota bacterium]
MILMRSIGHTVIPFLFLATVLLNGCSQEKTARDVVSQKILMGTFVQVKARSNEYSDTDLRKILEKAFERAVVLEKKFDLFDPNSELNMLNLSGKMNVSSEMFDVLEKALEIGSLTDGKFDITVSPILKEKGFYHDMPPEILEKIPDTKEAIGLENIMLTRSKRTVTLFQGAWLDLSGIAKGYIVDEMYAYIKEEGVKSFLIDAGGDMYCYSEREEDAWIIGVRDPGGYGMVMRVKINAGAIATSGDYENVVEGTGGRILAHIAVPEERNVLEKKPSSVTVISSSCAEADALATGMMAMETETAIELADQLEEVEIMIINNESSGEKVKISKGAETYIL